MQPGSYDGGTRDDQIGELYRFSPLVRGTQQPECPVAAGVQRTGNNFIKMMRPNYEMKLIKYTRNSNLVDAALAKPLESDMVNEEILEIGEVKGVKEPEVGMTVQKSGRTTGVTKGEVTAVGASLRVELGENEYGWFSDQVVSDAKVNAGDSGSLALDEENNAVGLVFAGSDEYCILNHINNVLEKLQITF